MNTLTCYQLVSEIESNLIKVSQLLGEGVRNKTKRAEFKAR